MAFFLAVKNFFWYVFKNTQQNNNCVSFVFKAESEPQQEENFFSVCVFLQKPKMGFLGVKIK